jgi:hypothetical protein
VDGFARSLEDIADAEIGDVRRISNAAANVLAFGDGEDVNGGRAGMR